jgi:DivIVA domain-containing protein
MTDDQPPTSEESATGSSVGPVQEQRFGELRHYVPPELLNVSFPVSVRGYDRAAVDAYIKRVNRVIAELKVGASPRAAVTHALEQTEQQVSGLLQRARETGEEITASAREEAEETVAEAKVTAADLMVSVSSSAEEMKAEAKRVVADARTKAEDTLARARLEAENMHSQAHADAERRQTEQEQELAELRQEAEARMRELQSDTNAVRNERDQLLEQMRRTASGLLELADTASTPEPSRSEEETLEPESVDDVLRAGVEAIAATPEDVKGKAPRRARS